MLGFLAGLPAKISAVSTYLSTHLSSTRAAKIDNLDAAISTRAAASTAVSNADLTSTKIGYLDAAISGRLGSIKSIQQGVITISSSAYTGTATITSVSTTRSILIFLGYSGSGSEPPAFIQLTNATTVTASRMYNTASACQAAYMVVEFNA